MSGLIYRNWIRWKGKKNFPHALVYGVVHPDANIGEGAWIPFGTRVGPCSSIGRYSYVMPSCHLQYVHIGNFCSLAENISFFNHQHNIKAFSTFPFSKRLAQHGIAFQPLFEESVHKGDIHIGNDVWVGAHVSIMGGVKIGNGAIIATGSIVTKDVAPYSIVAGTPAKKIRFRFSENICQQLQKTAWWDWPIEKIQAKGKALITITQQG